MFVIAGFKTIQYRISMNVYMIYFHTIFLKTISNGSLVTATNTNVKCGFYTAALSSIYVLQKENSAWY